MSEFRSPGPDKEPTFDRFTEPGRRAVEQYALEHPEFDYYDIMKPAQPKYEIGQYVASHGIPVPLIDSEELFQHALQDGSLFLRSEHEQDYGGFPGIFTSMHTGSLESYYYPIETHLLELARQGEVSPLLIPQGAQWHKDRARFMEKMWGFGVPKDIIDGGEWGFLQPTISAWTFVEGLNVRLYRDPHVAGRYHFGATQSDGRGKTAWYIDPETYDKPIKVGYGEATLDPVALIELYEQVRALPHFDQKAVPLLELQQDQSGALHFLQYYKTGKRLEEQEPFELPDAPRAPYAYGVTPPEGKDVRIYIQPRTFSEGLVGQGCYYEADNELILDGLLSRLVSVYVDDCYVSLKGGHAAASILHQPDVSISLFGRSELREVFSDLKRRAERTGGNTFIEAHVTANGLEATIVSDFVLTSE
jgi:hypothetical protein